MKLFPVTLQGGEKFVGGVGVVSLVASSLAFIFIVACWGVGFRSGVLCAWRLALRRLV